MSREAPMSPNELGRSPYMDRGPIFGKILSLAKAPNSTLDTGQAYCSTKFLVGRSFLLGSSLQLGKTFLLGKSLL